MNYNMQGMDIVIPELFAMLKAAKVEIKKEHQVLMIRPLVSRRARARRETLRMFKQLLLQ